MRLQDYPRPADDNGLGIHFGLDLRQSALDAYVPIMAGLNLKWCLVAHQDELQLNLAARAIADGGMMPVSRWICKIDQSILDFVRFVTILKGLNLPPYIQIFNEPGDIREWKSGSPDFNLFVQRWMQHAAAVADAGGYPGLQLLDPNELRVVLRALKEANATNVIDRMWFCPHPYGANHPPDYPYDALNQQDHPGATVFDDDITVIGFLEFEPIFRQELGTVPPFIAGEGGWQFGSSEDTRYPVIDDQLHAQFHATMFDSFRTGVLPNGDPLPDYLFAFCPWILFGPDAAAWYSWVTGTRRQTMIGIQDMPPFIRQFQSERPTVKSMQHVLLLGTPTASVTRSLLVGARKYIYQFAPTLTFSPADAAFAQNVTIIGDGHSVPSTADAQLRSAGCQVERINGDQYSVDMVLADRVTRNAEYG